MTAETRYQKTKRVLGQGLETIRDVISSLEYYVGEDDSNIIEFKCAYYNLRKMYRDRYPVENSSEDNTTESEYIYNEASGTYEWFGEGWYEARHPEASDVTSSEEKTSSQVE